MNEEPLRYLKRDHARRIDDSDAVADYNFYFVRISTLDTKAVMFTFSYALRIVQGTLTPIVMLNLSTHQALINTITGIVQLTEEEITALLPLMKYKEYGKDEHLTRQGETENFLYFILEGCIRNYTLHDDEEYSLDFYFTGNFTTSYMSFLLREPSTVNVQALVPSKVMRIHHGDLQKMYDNFKSFERVGRVITESSYIRRTRREFAFITQTAQERYLALVASHNDIIQNIPQKYIASYLGIKAESLSRIRGGLSKTTKTSSRQRS